MMADVSFPPMDEMSEEQFSVAMKSPMWRLENLYYIKTKSADDEDEDGDGVVVKFKPNRAQRRLLERLHYKNLILKARQLGFTTLIQLLFLDFAMFTPNLNIGVIAHTDDAAKKIFKKIKFAYDRLPKALRDANPLTTCSVREMVFKNGSTITVGTSMRGDTIHYLHISEYGKICAKFPDRAEEVVTGTLPAVPDTGMVFIESTAEGQDGDFYDKSQRAEAHYNAKTKLTPKQYRFHFFPWHDEVGYSMPAAGVIISQKEHEYFDQIEAELGKVITPEQRAWWISTRDETFSGQNERMWQEYPSTPKEAFQQSTEGTYYAVQLAAARKTGRIGMFPHVDNTPVNTFWDIGNSDGTAIWFHQRIGAENRFVKFIEGWGEPYSYFIKEMQKLGYVWGTHYLPHDGDHKRQQGDKIASPFDELIKFKIGGNWVIVPRVEDVNHGIQKTREVFGQCTFDESGCKDGIAHISHYKKEWNARLGCWGSNPRHDIHSEAADALRQFAQGYRAKSVIETPRRRRDTPDWRTA